MTSDHKANVLEETLEQKLRRYSLSPFSKDEGERKKVIIRDLKSAGLNPKVDKRGNVYVVKNPESTNGPIVISSHIDSDFGLIPGSYIFGVNGDGNIIGTLDNSVGCAINSTLAIKSTPDVKTYFFFTVSEETVTDAGAKEIRATVKEKNPLFITLDVTEENMNEPFNLENISPTSALPLLNAISENVLKRKPALKVDGAWDESKVYGDFGTAFSVCPVISGGVHSRTSEIKREYLHSTYDFLFKILQRPDLAKEVEKLGLIKSDVRERVKSFSREAFKLGLKTGRFNYFFGDDHWYTCAYLPRQMSHTAAVEINKSKSDKSTWEEEKAFFEKLKTNPYANPTRDNLGICLVETEIESIFVLEENRFQNMAYDYTITFHFPKRDNYIIEKVMALSEKITDSQTKSYDYMKLCFNKVPPEEKEHRRVLDAFSKILNIYDSLRQKESGSS